MHVTDDYTSIPFEKNRVASVGSFDGVHRAHQAVIETVVERAKERSGKSLVVTFDPHPRTVLRPDKEFNLLTTIEERKNIFADLGVETLLVIPFTYEFSRYSFREFYERYLVKGTGVSEVIEGYDHHFGRDREGTVEELIAMGREFEFSVTAMKPVYVGEEVVSSSGIRKHLLAGNVDRAAALLGRPYAFKGVVVKGDGRGKELGYPTANLDLSDPNKVVPGNGIYFVGARWERLSYYGMASIGVRPTFGESGKRTVEVHILDFDGDLYGRELEMQVFQKLRDERKFDSVRELIVQMDGDKEQSLRLIDERTKILAGPSSKRNVG